MTEFTADIPSIPIWTGSPSSEHIELYSQSKSFLESKEIQKAKEHIERLFQNIGGEEECKSKKYHELFYLRGEIKSKLPEPCHNDFLIAFQLSDPKNIDYIKRGALEAKKQYHTGKVDLACALEWVAFSPDDLEAKIVLLGGYNSMQMNQVTEDIKKQRETLIQQILKGTPDQDSQPVKNDQPTKYMLIHPEQLDQLKSNIQRHLQEQNEMLKKMMQQISLQNDLLLQAVNQQNQQFPQLQSQITQLQNKLDSLTNISASSAPSQNSQTASNPPPTTPTSSTTSSSSSFIGQRSESTSRTGTASSSTYSSQEAPPQSTQEPSQEERKPRPSVGSSDEAQIKHRADSAPVHTNNTDTPKSEPKPRTATFTPTPSSALVKPSYTMEGWLHKLGGWNKTKWESRYFSCDGIELIYHASQQIIQTTSPKGNIYLKDIVSVEEVHFDVHKVNHCFAIQTLTKKYFFYADDEITKMKWISALKRKPA